MRASTRANRAVTIVLVTFDTAEVTVFVNATNYSCSITNCSTTNTSNNRFGW